MVTSSVDSIARLWDDSGTLLKAMKDHKDMVMAAKWNREGNIIATAGYDSKIVVSNLNLYLLALGPRRQIAMNLQPQTNCAAGMEE